LALAASFVLGLATGCSGSENAAGNDTKTVKVPPGYTHYPVDTRKVAPKLSGETIAGGQLSLTSLKGKVVVVNFWGSWCPPCRAESSALMQVAKASASKGVTFVGVDERDTKPNALSFDRGHGVTYPSVFDEDGSIAAQWPAAAGPPYTFIIDRQGRVAARFLGGVTADELQSAVDKVTAEG
jgi:DsbE subfamily thiol:disulfide oxidoreductase